LAERGVKADISMMSRFFRLERHGSREPVGHGGRRASKVMPHLDFLRAARAEKSDITQDRSNV
jgi:hypothetical protein